MLFLFYKYEGAFSLNQGYCESFMSIILRNFVTSLVPPYNEPTQPCNPSPCGSNAICKERNGVGSCRCIENYFGDPYIGCRPECVTSSDCPSNKACYQNKCKDVCNGACGNNALCVGVNHVPMCYCIDGYTGDARSNCYEIPKISKNCFILSLFLKFLETLFNSKKNPRFFLLSRDIIMSFKFLPN